jgi:hypothetical protein
MVVWAIFLENGFYDLQSKAINKIIKMSTTNKQIENKLYALVECLADNYGFDADKAFEFIQDETEVNHLAGFLTSEKEEKKTEEKEKKSPLEKTRHNVSLWTKKLNADKFKDADAKSKHIEKLEKERKKLDKLEAAESKVEEKPKVEKKTEEKPKVEKKPKPEKKAEEKPKVEKKADSDEKPKKRIPRMSPTLSGQLKTSLDGVGLEMTDKLKKEFVKYVDELTEDDFRKDSLADHMRAFAKIKAPEPEDDKEESTIHQLPVSDLKSISVLTSVETTGHFWDADNGRMVTGPLEDEDEDFSDPIDFDGKKYIIGEKTSRVYEVRDDGDVFAGFFGIGKFKSLDM